MKRKFLFAAIISFFIAGLAAYGLCSSETTNLNLTKPAKGDRNWGQTVNNNMDLIDSAVGTIQSKSDDLPEVYVYTGTFNASTGVDVTLPKVVSNVNEYAVEVIPTSRGGAIDDVYVTKTTSKVTVHCSAANTTDTFECKIYYIGDVSSYGSSIYRKWYVSPDTGITDHGDTTQVGSWAWVLAQISVDQATVELPGNKTYHIRQDLNVTDNIQLSFQKGAFVDKDFSIRDTNYEWYPNGATNEYYLQASGGGNPNVDMPSVVTEDGSQMPDGSAGTLAAGEWDWNDVNGLGYSTVYVKLSDSTDPDGKSADYVIAGYTLTINFAAGSVPEIYPEMWGVDGINDDIEIEAAIASGAAVKIPARLTQDYAVGGLIDLPANSYLFSTNKATLTAKNAMNTSFFEIKGSNIVVDGLRIAGNAANQTAISNGFTGNTNADNVEVKNCDIDSVYGYGFQIINATISGWKIHHNTFTNCGLAAYGGSRAAVSFQTTGANTFSNVAAHDNFIDTCGSGIGFYSSTGGAITNIHMHHNTVLFTELIPLELNSVGVDNCEISGNIIKGSGTNGISGMFGGSVISNNTIEDQTIFGIEFNGDGVAITGNQINNCGIGILSANGASNFSISGNTIKTTTAGTNHDAIRLALDLFSEGSISNNFIFDPYASGITVYGNGTIGDVSNISIKNNTIIFQAARAVNCSPVAIHWSNAENLSITGNFITTTVEDSGHYWVGIINTADTSKNINISNNTILGLGSVIDNRGIDLHITDSYVFIENNTIRGLTRGIDTSDCTNPYVQIKGNIIEGCTQSEISHLSHKTEQKAVSPTQGALWNKGDQVWDTAPAGSGVPGWVCVSRVKTEMRVAGSSTDTTMEVDSTTGMTAGDIAGVELDDGTWHWTTVASVTDGDTFVLTAGLPSAAAIDNDVITNLWKTMAVLGA